MKSVCIYIIFALVISFKAYCQQFGHFASATYIQTCTNQQFYNNSVQRASPDCINPNCSIVFDSMDFGTFFKNSNDLILKGGELKTFRDVNSNVCGSKLYYTIYTIGNRPSSPIFSQINLPHVANCDLGNSTFQDNYGPCIDRDQKWGTQSQQIDLTTFPQGSYALEVYFEAFGDHTSTTLCDDTVSVNNNNNNFIALFQIVDVSISANGPTSFCQGDSVSLTSSQISGNIWNTGETTQSITINSSGTYSLVIPSLNACQTIDQASKSVTVNPLPVVSAGSDITICKGNQVTLIGSGANSYIWNNGISNNISFTPTQGGTYIVTGTNSSSLCSNTDTINLTLLDFPTANISANGSLFEVNTLINLINLSTNASNFVWNFNNGQANLTTTDLSSQQISYSIIGDYYISLSASNGFCSDIDSILIKVVKNDSVEITIPNIFTPNNDENNDTFFLSGKNISEIYVTIFNRWGEIMVELTNDKPKWDGKYNGLSVSDGVYFYRYKVKDTNNVWHNGQNFLTVVK